uniref:Thymopoietin n=1 Tax=Molossus molossus TaxID=27622 RepID=A0A7J8G2F6_MOLMO|nr:thymopoietin [Molossus molossus]
MFPFEASTPTGIRYSDTLKPVLECSTRGFLLSHLFPSFLSASCRRPIKGAAGRPLEFSDFRMEESFSSKYIPKYVPLADVKSEKTKKGRSIPMWIKILLVVVVAIFLFLVYQAMETNQVNPFSTFYLGDSKSLN